MEQKINILSYGFKLDLSVGFFEKVRGKKLYKVYKSKNNHAVFVGSKDECMRYLKIFQEKIDKQLNRKRPCRNSTKRTYRADLSGFSYTRA